MKRIDDPHVLLVLLFCIIFVVINVSNYMMAKPVSWKMIYLMIGSFVVLQKVLHDED
jgi:hypothetical protein